MAEAQGTTGDPEQHPHTHPEHYHTAYEENTPEEFDPTHLGDAAHHPEHFHTAYSDNNPTHHLDPTKELGEPDYSDNPDQS